MHLGSGAVNIVTINGSVAYCFRSRNVALCIVSFHRVIITAIIPWSFVLSIFWFCMPCVFVVIFFIRPPGIVVSGLIFYQGFFFFFFFFFAAYSPSLLNGTQPKSTTCSEITAIRNRRFKIWGIPSPTNREPKNHLLGRLCNLTANLTAHVFGTEHDIDNRSSVLTTTRGLLHCCKMS